MEFFQLTEISAVWAYTPFMIASHYSYFQKSGPGIWKKNLLILPPLADNFKKYQKNSMLAQKAIPWPNICSFISKAESNIQQRWPIHIKKISGY